MSRESLGRALADIAAVTRGALVNFTNHECTQRSAGLAYYALFSLFPLLLLAISAVGFMLDAGVPLAMDAQTFVLRAVARTLPEATELVAQILVTTRRARGSTGLVGLLVLLWSASNIFIYARRAFDTIWRTSAPAGIGGLVRMRFNALGLALLTGLLLFAATLSDTILEFVARLVHRLPWSDTLWFLGRPLLVTAVTVLLCAMLYRFLPRAQLSWGDVWPGAIIAGVGWEVLKRTFVLYATSASEWAAVYGPIAGVMGLLLWLYLSAQVLLFGAEFAAAYARFWRERHAIVPALAAAEGLALEVGPAATPTTGASASEGRLSLTRGTVVGLAGAVIAVGVAVAGLVAAGRRKLGRQSAGESPP